jgi:hypothetical protein
MAKTKTREEMIAEENEKAKKIAEANKGTGEVPNAPAPPGEVNDAADTENEPDAPLSPEALAEFERIAASEEGANTDDAEQRRDAASQKAEDAHDKLRRIAVSYPQTTPDEHTVFGFGGERFNLGELRALFQIPGPRG